jgi:lysozyme
MNNQNYSDAGFALIRSFEGLRLTAYQDTAGVWTIGYGHTGAGVIAGLSITEAEAEVYLHLDLMQAIACVKRAVTAELTQNQFDALVDFCFNLGGGTFERSTLLCEVNALRMNEAVKQFALWNHAAGKVSAGLTRRRAAEAQMFASLPATPVH